uniref:Uncharacterized protein n=1 Tax=Anguilla anguilla TaxID=7936 RepID=A0A0E9UV63_ANGAN
MFSKSKISFKLIYFTFTPARFFSC